MFVIDVCEHGTVDGDPSKYCVSLSQWIHLYLVYYCSDIMSAPNPSATPATTSGKATTVSAKMQRVLDKA